MIAIAMLLILYILFGLDFVIPMLYSPAESRQRNNRGRKTNPKLLSYFVDVA
jgi:hypothetical protein